MEQAVHHKSISKALSRRMQMKNLGIPSQYTNWIIGCYVNRNIKIDTVSGLVEKSTDAGIPQGDVLSPTVFLIYTSFLELNGCDNAMTFQFADDICILAWDVGEIDANNRLQSAMNSFLRKVKEIDMEINLNKTLAVCFFAHYCYTPRLFIDEDEVKFTDQVKYLCIYADCRVGTQN